MRVLLSIKPEYAKKIFEGTKLYEFRRSIFKNPDIKSVVVYASSPIQKVIGEFEIEMIITDKIAPLWQQTKEFSGISKEYFFQYFEDKETGFAIKIRAASLYKTPKCIRRDFNVVPPQSFLYIE